MGLLLGAFVFSDGPSEGHRPLKASGIAALTIACLYVVGRYFAYALVGINSAYASNPAATFIWTLGMGLAVGIGYTLLARGLKGKTVLSRALWFGCVVFGIYWLLNNFFMIVVFDMSFIAFDPPVLNYVYRSVIDIIFVTLGVWIVESTYVQFISEGLR